MGAIEPNVKPSIDVEKIQEVFRTRILAIMSWATSFQVHAEIATRHLHLYRCLPTVDESVSIAAFGADRLRFTYGQDMIPPHPLPLANDLSVLAQAWRAVPGRLRAMEEAEEQMTPNAPREDIQVEDEVKYTGKKQKEISR